MGRRQKLAPKRLNSSLNDEDDDRVLGQIHVNDCGFIPVIKKRRKSKRISENIKYEILQANENNKDYFIGNLIVGQTNNTLPIEYTNVKAVIPKKIHNCKVETIILEFDECSVVVNVTIDLVFLKEVFSTKTFSCSFELNESGEILLKLYLTSLPLNKFTPKIGSCIKTVFKLLLEISDDEDVNFVNEENKMYGHHEIINIYKRINDIRKEDNHFEEIDVQHTSLIPKLRQYQADAVRWMLNKEKICDSNDENNIHPLYTPITLNSGTKFYYNKHTGYIELEAPEIESSCPGGILADEMGLGKTVEFLALILLHRKPHENCPVNLSSDDDEEDEIKSSPTVDRFTVKRKRVKKLPEATSFTLKNKCYIPENWVKGSSKKSANRIALEQWYNSQLAEMQILDRKPNFKYRKIQCVCGSNNSTDKIVKCIKCQKIQHKVCVGYKKSTCGLNFKCGQCWEKEPLLESRATLIVTPQALRTQWCDEICKHLKENVKVLQYDGYRKTQIYPTQLQNYDLIITTYNVLQGELPLTECKEAFTFRRARKYAPPCSPLIRVKFWRLCLDEAQTVETPTRMVSTMSRKLSAVYRWAVTGTPISKGISDLYGLIDYLQIKPYDDFDTWKFGLLQPYKKGNDKPMCEFLAKTLWRSSKADVLDQINIPPQTFLEHFLEFSAVEKYFYKREHELIAGDFLDKLKGYDLTLQLAKMDKIILNRLLSPLFLLRQICTHPNTLRGRYLATKKKLSSMKDLLDALILKNLNEGEDNLRFVISALNGLAGIYLLMHRYEDAIKQYRKVLQLMSRFTEDSNETIKLEIDKPLLIHTMHNLADVLDNFPTADKTLRDDSLRQDCALMEQKFIAKFIKQSVEAYGQQQALSCNVEKLQDKFVLRSGQWYSDGLGWIYTNSYFDDLLTKIDIAVERSNYTGIVLRNPSERQLLTLLANWDELISDLRLNLFESIDKLFEFKTDGQFQIEIRPQVVEKATDCHLRPQKGNRKGSKKKCPVCVANENLKAYEAKLFRMTNRQMDPEMALQGNWLPSIEELTLKSILHVLKSKMADEDIVNDGENHIHLMEALKKEFKEIRKFWTLLDQQICAEDELNICKIRLQLSTPESTIEENRVLKNLNYENDNKLETLHLVSVHELDYHEITYQKDYEMYLAKLEQTLGPQSYLETLRKQQYEGHNPDPCPICKNAVEQHWCILPCGHNYCMECIDLLLNQSISEKIQCSVCRRKQKVEEISYIKSGQTSEQDDVSIKGNYSTKIEGIVKFVLDLKNKEPNVKILIFSTWITVLNSLKEALKQNGVTCEVAMAATIESRVEKFKKKDVEDSMTALLLPVQHGSKGLNLIEATHVVMVEPLLNPGDELQAIGRVHRIGQTKPTFVHKFIVKNTIEENIHQAISENAEDWDKNKITLQQLVNLFMDDATVESVSLEDVTMEDEVAQPN